MAAELMPLLQAFQDSSSSANAGGVQIQPFGRCDNSRRGPTGRARSSIDCYSARGFNAGKYRNAGGFFYCCCTLASEELCLVRSRPRTDLMRFGVRSRALLNCTDASSIRPCANRNSPYISHAGFIGNGGPEGGFSSAPRAVASARNFSAASSSFRANASAASQLLLLDGGDPWRGKPLTRSPGSVGGHP